MESTPVNHVYAVAYYDHRETVLLFYGSYEEAYHNLLSALSVDPTAKMRYPNGMREDRVQSENDYMAGEFKDMEVRGTEPRAVDYDDSDLPF